MPKKFSLIPQKAWHRWLILLSIASINLLIIFSIFQILPKQTVLNLPTEVVFVQATVTQTFTASPSPSTSPIAIPSPSPIHTPTVTSSPTSRPSHTATVTLSPSPLASDTATATNTPSPENTAAVVFLAPQATVAHIVPLVVVNPNEAIPTYATVPAGNEEFAQAVFRYVYGLHQIRELSISSTELRISFVLDMANFNWERGTGLVNLVCNFWRSGFNQQTFFIRAYQEIPSGIGEFQYEEKVRLVLNANQVPNIDCGQSATVDLATIATVYWYDS